MKTIREKISRPLGAAVLGASTLAGGMTVGIATAQPAGAAVGISGYVMCVDQLSVTGIWIQAVNGGSGFAARQGTGLNYYNHFTYSLPRGGAWTVHVGCGGTTSKWKYSPNGVANTNLATQSWTCYTPDTGQPGSFCQRT